VSRDIVSTFLGSEVRHVAGPGVAAGTPVEIEIQNSGQASHNFTSEARNVITGPKLESGRVDPVIQMRLKIDRTPQPRHFGAPSQLVDASV